MEIKGRVAVVTGGASGIGATIARRLAQEGARVVVADRDERHGVATAAEIEGAFVCVDVTQEAQARRMVAFAVERYGYLDILVNNAGGYEQPVFPEAPTQHWSAALDLNLRATMLCIGAALPAMAGTGVIVNVASAAGTGTRPYDGAPEYAAAKAAVIRLTAAMREREGVRINCVSPDWVGTEAVRASIAAMSPDERAEVPALIAPSELADGVIRLVRDDGLAGRIMVLWGGEPPRLLPADRRD